MYPKKLNRLKENPPLILLIMLTLCIPVSGDGDHYNTRKMLQFADDGGQFPPDLFSEDSLRQGAVVLHIIGLLYMFYALAFVYAHFFIPCLMVLGEKLDWAPDAIGAGIIAGGVSFPGLIAACIGVFVSTSAVGFGSIVGPSVFNFLLMFVVCAFAATPMLSVTVWPMLRDALFYLITLLLFAVFFIDGKMEWWEALILLMLYIAYLVLMAFNNFARDKLSAVCSCLKGASSVSVADSEVQTSMRKIQDGEQDTGADDDQADEEEYKDPLLTGPQGTIMNKINWFISLPVMLLMWITTPDPRNPERRKLFPLTFIISSAWILALAYLIVWWGSVIGKVCGIPPAIMGLTLIAAGTNVPLFIAVARQRSGDLAVSFSVGLNVFKLTAGSAVPWLLECAFLQLPSVPVNTAGMICSVSLLVIMLILAYMVVSCARGRINKIIGIVMIVLYVLFMLVAIAFAFNIVVCPL